jgi:hypothetical protein
LRNSLVGVLLLVLIFASNVSAAKRKRSSTPNASVVKPKHFYTDKWWWVERVASAAAVGVDAWSTSDYLNVCPACGDSFPWFKLHSKGTIAGAAAIGFGLSTGVSLITWRVGVAEGPQDHTDALGKFSYVDDPMWEGILHGWAANHNWQFVAQCRRSALSCQP